MRRNQLEPEVRVEPKAMLDAIGRTPWRAPVITRIALARTLNTTGSPHDAFTSGTHA
jgi:hypothetical protein